ncbi:MAG TPA: nitrate reductase molybdenum cofactor assembly chaperone [Arenicellales bacterium]|nr:nitrate reductase molybdenum cofactor assembly chaperone [Arenicellales bacterium]
MSTLKVLAALLHYPDEQLQAHADELVAALDAEGLVRGRRRAAIVGFIERLRSDDLLERQAEYVETFDRGRSRSLHLYEHVHGESRDRGQAMVELNRVYREHGFEIAGAELPDYLPLFLEFLSTLPMEDAVGWLEEVGPILQPLHARLAERDSVYTVLVEPLVRLAGLTADESLREEIAKEAPDDTPEALDRVWMEAPVTFGPEGGCDMGGQHTEQTIQWHRRSQSSHR